MPGLGSRGGLSKGEKNIFKIKCISILGCRQRGFFFFFRKRTQTWRGGREYARMERVSVCGRDRKLDAVRGLGKKVQEKKKKKRQAT